MGSKHITKNRQDKRQDQSDWKSTLCLSLILRYMKWMMIDKSMECTTKEIVCGLDTECERNGKCRVQNENGVPPRIVVAPDLPLLRVLTSTAPNKRQLSPKLSEPASSLIEAPAARKLSATSLTSIPCSSFLRHKFFRRPPQCFHNPATSFDYVLKSTAPPSTSVSSPSVPPHSRRSHWGQRGSYLVGTLRVC